MTEALLQPKTISKKKLDELPFWDRSLHTLFWHGRAVKHFLKDAPRQEMILAVFQRAGWPACRDVRRLPHQLTRSKKRLRATIENLNRSLRGAIHFRLEGSGSRICWEPA